MKKAAQLEYRGKHFIIPNVSREGFEVTPMHIPTTIPADSPIIRALNRVWDEAEFAIPRTPVSLGVLPETEQALFRTQGIAPRVLDMPIKFPGSHFRVPKEFTQFLPVIRRVADYELAVNPTCYDEYYCYLTVEHGWVDAGELQREAPCHVDGFQGERWSPKVRGNHTYTVGDLIPTVYYVQPFAVEHLDPAKHDYFWDFNRQVAETNSAHEWRSAPFELTLMDCYSVHRGDKATERVYRTWVRLSFEVRIFDRLGNAHNPMFAYDWTMVPRDIEALNLAPYAEYADPSLNVFPWQSPDGTALPTGSPKTQPNLQPKDSIR